jgi:hypothetical protein
MKDKGMLLFIIILIGLFWFLTRKQSGTTAYYDEPYSPSDEPIKLRPLQPRSEEESGGKRYRNNETWEIEWTPDGLPGKVTIHRDARQT